MAIAGEVQAVATTGRVGPAHGSATSGAPYHTEEKAANQLSGENDSLNGCAS